MRNKNATSPSHSPLSFVTESLFGRFEEICAKFNGQCLQNGFLALKSNIQNILDGKIELTYPVTF